MSRYFVTKCDRCGNVIEKYCCVSIKDNFHPYNVTSIDLCEECKKEFEAWLKK